MNYDSRFMMNEGLLFLAYAYALSGFFPAAILLGTACLLQLRRFRALDGKLREGDPAGHADSLCLLYDISLSHRTCSKKCGMVSGRQDDDFRVSDLDGDIDVCRSLWGVCLPLSEKTPQARV